MSDLSDNQISNGTSQLQLPNNQFNKATAVKEELETGSKSEPDDEVECQSVATTEYSEDVQQTCLILTDLLPQKIAKATLLSKDGLADTLKSTLKKKLEYFPNHGKCHIKKMDLSFPKAYADKLKSDKSLTESIIDIMWQAAETVENLYLPVLDIKVLHSLLAEKKVLGNKKCTKISLPIVADSEIGMLLAEIVSSLVCLQPEEIDCSDETPETLTNRSLKSKLDTILKGTVNFSFRKIKIKSTIGVTRSKAAGRKKSIEKKLPQAPRAAARQGRKTKTFNLPPLPEMFCDNFTFDYIEPQQEVTSNHFFTAYQYWQLEKIHETATGRGITVAIVDCGIDPSHPAFDHKNITFKDFSNQPLNPYHTEAHYHGTLCSGIACGKKFKYLCSPSEETKDEAMFPSGVAPDADLVVCKVAMYGGTYASNDPLIQALDWIKSDASPPVDVVSLSTGSLKFIPEIAQAVTELVHKNIIVVCAASNLGNTFSQPICFPARLGHVLCIGSHGLHGKPSPFSPVGQQIDFLAPGENIAGPSNSLFYHHFIKDCGTSYAAPAVAGLICLILGLIKQHCASTYFEYFKKQWVMKEVLREISTSPGRHMDDQGFGALNPQRFFYNPEHVLHLILSELV